MSFIGIKLTYVQRRSQDFSLEGANTCNYSCNVNK
jgi:hypothetical protein